MDCIKDSKISLKQKIRHVLVGNVVYHNFCLLQNISLSVNDLLSCCGFMCGDGCDGGYPIYAWRYFVENGVVTEEVINFILNSIMVLDLCSLLFPFTP